MKVFLQYVSSSVTLNFHLMKMFLYTEGKHKVFHQYVSLSYLDKPILIGLCLPNASSVTLNFHLVKMTLYTEGNDIVFFQYGYSSVSLNFHQLWRIIYSERKE